MSGAVGGAVGGTSGGASAIALEDLRFVGSGLQRPECVLCHRSGLLFVSDWSGAGGVAVLDGGGGVGSGGGGSVGVGGGVRRVTATGAALEQLGGALRPNGIALLSGGSFLVAHLGDAHGGVWRLAADGTVAPVLVEVAGQPLPPTNFVHHDARGRIWATVSTRLRPRARGYRSAVADGFVVLQDGNGARIVADGLGYTNECALSPAGDELYVNETFARRTVAFAVGAVGAGGSLGRRRVVAEYGSGVFPDGLTFDAAGGLWITSVVSNRVIRIDPAGRQDVVVQDCAPEHLDRVEQAFRSGSMGAEHLSASGGRRLHNVSSLAFGGPQLRTAYLGCLLGPSLASFAAPYAGHPPPHWEVELGGLADAAGA